MGSNDNNLNVDDVINEARDITGADKRRVSLLDFLPRGVAVYLRASMHIFSIAGSLGGIGKRAINLLGALVISMPALQMAEAYAVCRASDDDGSDPIDWEHVMHTIAVSAASSVMSILTCERMSSYNGGYGKSWALGLFTPWRFNSFRVAWLILFSAVLFAPVKPDIEPGEKFHFTTLNKDAIRLLGESGDKHVADHAAAIHAIEHDLVDTMALLSTVVDLATNISATKMPMPGIIGGVMAHTMSDAVGKDEATRSVGNRFLQHAYAAQHAITNALTGSSDMVIEITDDINEIPDGRHIRALKLAMERELITEDDIRGIHASGIRSLRKYAESLPTWDEVKDTDPREYGGDV